MKTAICVIAGLLLLGRLANGQDIAVIRQRLESEVTRSYSEAREFAKHAKVRTRETLIDADSRETLRESHEEMIFAYPYVLHRWELDKVADTKARGFSLEERQQIRGTNPRYSFHLLRPRIGADWVLHEWSPAEKVAPDSEMGRLYNTISKGAWPNFIVNIMSLPDLLKDPTFRIKSGEYFDRDGRQFLRVFFTQGDPGSKKSALWDGSMIVDTKFWCLSEYAIKITVAGMTVQEKATSEYVGNGAGIALPVRWVKIQHRPKFASETVFDMSVEEYHAVPEVEFTLTAFGFPEPMGMPPVNRTSRWWMWIMGGGLACIVGASFWFRRIRRRKMQHPPVEASGVAAPGDTALRKSTGPA